MNSKRSVWLALGGLIIVGVIALIMKQDTIANVAVGGLVTAIGYLIGAKE